MACARLAIHLASSGRRHRSDLPERRLTWLISANFGGVVWGHSTPRTTILHNDSAVRKRFLY
jgi:hypothetical protein